MGRMSRRDVNEAFHLLMRNARIAGLDTTGWCISNHAGIFGLYYRDPDTGQHEGVGGIQPTLGSTNAEVVRALNALSNGIRIANLAPRSTKTGCPECGSTARTIPDIDGTVACVRCGHESK